MTKVGVERGKAVDRRAAGVALSNGLAPELKAAVMPGAKASGDYGVYVDAQGVPYLLVERTKAGARYLMNTGKRVDVAELDAATVSSRGLVLMPEVNVLESAKILSAPLSNGVIIAERAKQYLDRIIADPVIQAAAKEEPAMAKEKKAVKKGATKAAAPAKSGKAKSNGAGRSLDSHIIVAKAKENKLREGSFCQAQVAALQACDGKTVADAQKKLDASGKNPNKRRIEVAWATKQGYISTKAAPAN